MPRAARSWRSANKQHRISPRRMIESPLQQRSGEMTPPSTRLRTTATTPRSGVIVAEGTGCGDPSNAQCDDRSAKANDHHRQVATSEARTEAGAHAQACDRGAGRRLLRQASRRTCLCSTRKICTKGKALIHKDFRCANVMREMGREMKVGYALVSTDGQTLDA